MKDLTTFLQAIKNRLSAATPGPWKHRNGIVNSIATGRLIFWDDCPNVGDTHERIRPDYQLIANAPTDIATLLRLVETMSEALERIANHKQTSIDKVHLILQCEGYQDAAREALRKCKEMVK